MPWSRRAPLGPVVVAWAILDSEISGDGSSKGTIYVRSVLQVDRLLPFVKDRSDQHRPTSSSPRSWR